MTEEIKVHKRHGSSVETLPCPSQFSQPWTEIMGMVEKAVNGMTGSSSIPKPTLHTHTLSSELVHEGAKVSILFLNIAGTGSRSEMTQRQDFKKLVGHSGRSGGPEQPMAVDLRRLKEFVSMKLPPTSPLREVILQDRDVIGWHEFITKIDIWLKLLKTESQKK